ncbi:Mitochondrial distribution and morphology protein 10 [Coemansia sp. RSA 1822]|nr:Mitochondrial distribution and morphology protein 10 [Coemansia sp. RSA 638]KAJ2542276.1 Mitochondrial distribution and morphology protein 10 [Coemansia sp. RSA 1853]KAJ2559271.1 Mitochondrial distribution and morphology protein 10 [Coemansia sp. RSA 1822]
MAYTTSDYFPFLVRQFHHETGWNECNSYATFCRASKAILDFSIPYGLSVSTGRRVGSNLSSQLVFSMVPSSASSIGYLAASRPLFSIMPAQTAASSGEQNLGSNVVRAASFPSLAVPTLSDILSNPKADARDGKLSRQQQIQDELDSQDLLQNIRAGVWRCNWRTSDYLSRADYAGEYLAVAQLYPSLATITGSYVERRSATSELTISGVSVAGAQPDLQFILQHAVDRRRWSSEGVFGTSGRLLGLRGLYNFGDVAEGQAVGDSAGRGRISAGGEVYFGAQEASGGMSVGMRYRDGQPLLSELTCVLNPIMGHVSLALTRELRSRMCAAARYDFNAFSLSSELAVGVEWQLDQNSIVKARWSDSQGLRCLVDTRLNNMVFSMGLDLHGDLAPTPATTGIKRFVRSFGLQFQWFL